MFLFSDSGTEQPVREWVTGSRTGKGWDRVHTVYVIACLRVCVHVYMYMCVYECVQVFVCTCMCVHVCMYMCEGLCMYIQVCAYMCVRVCMCVHV